MKGKWLSFAALVLCGAVFLSLSSCGRDQQLVSIQIQPATETFGNANTPVQLDAGLQVQLRALGTYIHPPVTKDITSQVTWASNDTQMMTVDSSGMLTAAGVSCGSTLVSATMTTNTSSGGLSSKGALVTGYMTGNVVCFTGTGAGGTGSGASITITFSGNGQGTISSNIGGLNCASSQSTACTIVVPSGITVNVTASPGAASTFGGWGGGCSNVNGQVCTFTNVNSAVGATVTFN